MDVERLASRVGPAPFVGVGTLRDYRLTFNKLSTADGSGRANVTPTRGGRVEGVLLELDEEQFATLDRYEPGYHRERVTVHFDDAACDAVTYVADAHRTADGLQPTREYLAFIIAGARRFGLSDEYQRRLADIACRE